MSGERRRRFDRRSRLGRTRLFACLTLGEGTDDGEAESLAVQGFEHHEEPQEPGLMHHYALVRPTGCAAPVVSDSASGRPNGLQPQMLPARLSWLFVVLGLAPW